MALPINLLGLIGPNAGGMLSGASTSSAPGTMGLLGLDPAQLRQQQLFAGLSGIGQGVLGGQNWQQGLGLGAQAAGQNIADARQQAVNDAILGFHAMAYQREDEKYQREKAAEDAKAGAIGHLAANPPASWLAQGRTAAEWHDHVLVDPDGALKEIGPHPLEHISFKKGNQEITGFYDPNIGMSSFQQIGAGPAYAPTQPNEYIQKKNDFITQFRAENGGKNPSIQDFKDAGFYGGGSAQADWLTGKGPHGVEYKYNPKTGETNLARPSGGFYSVDELKGPTPGQPLVPYANPEAPTRPFDWSQYDKPAATPFAIWLQQFQDENHRMPTAKEVQNRGASSGVTMPEQANNAEIDAARKQLMDSGYGYQELVDASHPTLGTGEDNPHYDPYLVSTFRTASQHKVGDDPEFDSFKQRFIPQGQSGGQAVAGQQQLTPDQQSTVDQAKDAIAKGADEIAVKARMKAMGLDPALLDAQ